MVRYDTILYRSLTDMDPGNGSAILAWTHQNMISFLFSSSNALSKESSFGQSIVSNLSLSNRFYNLVYRVPSLKLTSSLPELLS